MTREQAQAISEELQAAHIDHEVKAVYLLGDAAWSVRGYLKPFQYESDDHARRHAKAVIDLMTSEGDWHIGGEIGRAYVARY
jgi:uncharacterized protein (UPF0212 family)